MLQRIDERVGLAVQQGVERLHPERSRILEIPDAPGGQPPELAEEHDDADDRQQERRRRRQQQQDAPADRGPRPPKRAGHRIQRRQHQRDEERGDDEFDGGWQIGGDVGDHRLAGAQRPAQVPGEQPAEEAEVPGEERVVQAEPLPLRGDHLRGRVGPDVRAGRVAGRNSLQHKDHQR